MSDICGAKKKDGGECKGLAMLNGRCRIHGGKSPKGVAHPNFKDGRTSKYHYLPERLSERVKEFAADPELVQLRENIAVMDARLTELYAMVDEGESSQMWARMQDAYAKYRKFENDPSKVSEANSARFIFEDLLEQGTEQQAIWAEIVGLTEQRRKLVESESKRLKDSQQIITAEQFMTFVQFIVSVIKENVKDRDAINNISEKLISAGTISGR